MLQTVTNQRRILHVDQEYRLRLAEASGEWPRKRQLAGGHMRIAHCVTLLASLLAFNQYALSAEGDQKGDGGKYPRTLTGPEAQKLYGERAMIIEYSVSKGSIRWEVFPDGRLFGHNLSSIGGAAALHGNSAGRWRVDASSGTVCHEGENTRWTNSCSAVVETEPGSYVWSRGGGPGGLKFTIKPQ